MIQSSHGELREYMRNWTLWSACDHVAVTGVWSKVRPKRVEERDEVFVPSGQFKVQIKAIHDVVTKRPILSKWLC